MPDMDKEKLHTKINNRQEKVEELCFEKITFQIKTDTVKEK